MSFSMKTIPVQDAVGTILCQDITRIVPGQYKGPVFRKGHVVTEEDIPVLLDVGKEHLYVYRPEPGMVHEEDAAWRIARCVGGANLVLKGPKEGRIDFVAECDGLLNVDEDLLFDFNSLGEMTLATLPGNIRVCQGQALGATRVTPLVVEEELLQRMESTITRPVLSVTPFASPLVGIVTTGSEVYAGRIRDGFGPVLRERFASLGCPVAGQKLSGDDADIIANAILDFAAPYERQGLRLSATGRPYIREPCSCWPTLKGMAKPSPSWDFREGLCTARSASSISLSQDFLPGRFSRLATCTAWGTEVS